MTDPKFGETLRRTGMKKEIICLELAGFEDLAPFQSLKGLSVVLIAADSQSVDWAVTKPLVEFLLDRDATYFCTWGPGCESLHDCIDKEIAIRQVKTGQKLPLVVTTWHDTEPLEEAVWFAAQVASPEPEHHADNWQVLLVSVGNTKWANRIRKTVGAF
ncbi:MAG: hypothetical protein ACE363_06120 [Alphaproteobacteria bacterium]